MSSNDKDQQSDSQPVPTPTPRFTGLLHLFRSFSTPDTKPSTIPPDPEPGPETPGSSSPIDEERPQVEELDDVESVTSASPLQRFWRHASSKTTSPAELSPSRRTVPEPSITTEHDSPSPTLSKSASTAADELEAVSPMPTTLITPPDDLPGSNTPGRDEYPTPASLAQRIHSIIASTPTAIYQPMVLESPTTPVDQRTLLQSPQSPSSVLSPMADTRFLSFLRSPRLMSPPGLGQESVFSVLEHLQSPMSRNRELPPEGGPNGNDGQDGRGVEVTDDGSSLMLCSPLIPQRDSLVEMAETEYVSFNGAGRATAENVRSPLHQAYTVDEIDEQSEPGDEQGSEANQDPAGSSADADNGEGQATGTESRSIFRWPWFKTEEEKRVELKAKQEKQKAEAKANEEQRLKKKEKLVWVPSPTKISLQTMWWGYRIYFPPPVLEILNNKQLEAAKRAAMITTALRWLLDNLPLALIPPQFQLALSLLRGLVPLLGYIGSFIAWSWSAIRVFDRGYGVTLTATWLLPIAIIPGTWQVFEVPETPQITQGEPPSQHEPTNTDNVGRQKGGESAIEKTYDEPEPEPEPVPELKASISQKLDQDQAWGLSSSYISGQQPPQGYWDPSPSVVWAPSEHGYPNPTYSSSGSFHYAQPHYPPGAYFTPSYPTPVYGYFQPTNLEQTPQTYEPTLNEATAPPPVVVHTVPLPSSRPSTPPRR